MTKSGHSDLNTFQNMKKILIYKKTPTGTKNQTHI